MLQLKCLNSFGKSQGFQPVNRIGNAVYDVAKPAISGAFFTQNHKTCSSGIPAFAFIRAIPAGAYRI
jgi:hypothetical protein